MALDTRKTSSLWKDQALVEVNIAVLYSFQVRPVPFGFTGLEIHISEAQKKSPDYLENSLLSNNSVSLAVNDPERSKVHQLLLYLFTTRWIFFNKCGSGKRHFVMSQRAPTPPFRFETNRAQPCVGPAH